MIADIHALSSSLSDQTSNGMRYYVIGVVLCLLRGFLRSRELCISARARATVFLDSVMLLGALSLKYKSHSPIGPCVVEGSATFEL